MFTSKTKIWIISGIVLSLILGFSLGIIVVRTNSMMCYRSWMKHRGKEAKTLANERILNRLSRKLDLTQPQIQAIGGILRVKATKLKQIQDESYKKKKMIMEEAHEQIKQHLDPEQQRKYNKLIISHRKRWEKGRFNKKCF